MVLERDGSLYTLKDVSWAVRDHEGANGKCLRLFDSLIFDVLCGDEKSLRSVSSCRSTVCKIALGAAINSDKDKHMPASVWATHNHAEGACRESSTVSWTSKGAVMDQTVSRIS